MHIKTLFKKYLSFIMVMSLFATCVFGCAPKPQDVFEQEADQWFDTFSDAQSVVKSKVTYEYSKTGSVAVSKPSMQTCLFPHIMIR